MTPTTGPRPAQARWEPPVPARLGDVSFRAAGTSCPPGADLYAPPAPADGPLYSAWPRRRSARRARPRPGAARERGVNGRAKMRYAAHHDENSGRGHHAQHHLADPYPKREIQVPGSGLGRGGPEPERDREHQPRHEAPREKTHDPLSWSYVLEPAISTRAAMPPPAAAVAPAAHATRRRMRGHPPARRNLPNAGKARRPSARTAAPPRAATAANAPWLPSPATSAPRPRTP